MSKIKDDIKRAEELICMPAFYRNDKNIFDMIYPFTNENIKGMFECFDFKDKDCLSVLGSSDQTFDMYLRGAKSVTAFDINPLTKYLFYLKRAALKADLTKEEYLSFFCSSENYDESKESFNEEIFSRIVPFLRGNSYKFWTELYTRYSGYKIRERNCLFSFDEYKKSTLENTVYYLSDKGFEKIKEMSSSIKITFVNKDIKDLILSKNYDLMYFSNLIQYVSNIFYQQSLYETRYEEERSSLQDFRDFIMKYKNSLNDRGVMIIGYIYSILEECEPTAIFNKQIRDEVFPNDTYSYEFFKSTSYLENDYLSKIPTYEKDACLVYKKTI